MYEYTQEIRDLINNPRKQFNLLKNRLFWNQSCSSLDVIEDSDLAIDAYVNSEFPEENGEKYLRLYGVLQALFVQQNAVIDLCKSLGVPDNIHPKLKRIRDIRNDSIRHPTDRGKEKHKSYHFISRHSITKSKFRLESVDKNDKTTFENIQIIDLIKDQRTYLPKELKKIVGFLKSEEKKHKERFKMEKLEDIFLNTYHISKILEGISKPEYGARVVRSAESLQSIKNVMDNFKKSLKKREIEIETYDSIKSIYELLEYPLKKLELYFKKLSREKKPAIDDKTAYIFAYFIGRHLPELKEIAKNIDTEYSS